MQLTLLTPHRKLVDGQAIEEVVVPGVAGTLDMLPGHANFVSPLETGMIKWKSADKWFSATVSYGIVEVFEGNVSVMADVSEIGAEIDIARAKKAMQFAQQKIGEGGLDDTGMHKYELKLKRSMARLSASGEE